MAGPRVVSYGFIKLLQERRDDQFIAELQKHLAVPTNSQAAELPVIEIVDDGYELRVEDTGATLLINFPEAGSVIVPASLDIPPGYGIKLVWYGLGQPSILAAPGVIIRSMNNR